MSTNGASSFKQGAKYWLARSMSAADNWLNIKVRYYRRRWLGRPGVPKIQPYMGYASNQSIHVMGRVLTNPLVHSQVLRESLVRNLRHTIQRFASDEVPGITVEATLGGVSVRGLSDAEGYFHITIPRGQTHHALPYWSMASLRIVGDPAASELPATTCQVVAVNDYAQFGIISDIDDTVIHTGVTNLLTMAKLTFFGSARTRAPLEGVAKLYELLHHGGQTQNDPVNPIFYVSSSPWNLYDLLEEFLRINAIPQGPLLLRDFGFDENKLFRSGNEHKLDKVRSLLRTYHELPFILFGDSGQEDARLYASAAREFGNRIRAIFIRDVDPKRATTRDRSVKRFFDAAGSVGVPMYLVRDSIEAAEIAIDQGLLPTDVLSSVVDATLLDRSRGASILEP